MKKLIINNGYSLIYIVTLLFLFVDVYNSRDTVAKFLHISSVDIAICSVLLLSLLRIFFKKSLISKLYKINLLVIFPISLLLGIALTVYDFLTPPNAAFALVRVQYIQLIIISIFSLLVILLQQSNVWLKKHYHQVIFASFFVVTGYAYITSLFPSDIFAQISKEDHLIENTQVIVLLIGVLLAAQIAILIRSKYKVHAFIFLFAAIALFFVAGDEISWGQRIFHLATPEVIMNNNDQNEITIHNLSAVSGFVGISYIVIGFYGSLAWVSQVIFPKLKNFPTAFYIPPWYCVGFYFLGFLYNYYSLLTPKYNAFPLWAEYAELMIYSGIMLTLLCIKVRLRNQ